MPRGERQASLKEIVASAVGELRQEAIASRTDAERAATRGFVVLAGDLKAQAGRLERLATSLADLVRDGGAAPL